MDGAPLRALDRAAFYLVGLARSTVKNTGFFFGHGIVTMESMSVVLLNQRCCIV